MPASHRANSCRSFHDEPLGTSHVHTSVVFKPVVASCAFVAPSDVHATFQTNWPESKPKQTNHSGGTSTRGPSAPWFRAGQCPNAHATISGNSCLQKGPPCEPDRSAMTTSPPA